MLRRILQFFNNEHGQDLAEYCLITALIALLGLAIFYKVSGGMGDMWSVANTRLGASNAAVSSTTPAASGSPQR